MTAALEFLPTDRPQKPVNWLESALRLNLEAGLRAFPLVPTEDDYKPGVTGYHGKIPYTRAELADMTWDRAIGVGVAEHPGIIGLDVDVKGGTRRGLLHLSQLTELYGLLPESPCFATKTGGFHVRYRLPRGTEGQTLREALVLTDGTETHIDVIQSRHRFYRVYDLQAWLDAAGKAPPELPESWLPAILKNDPARPVLRLVSDADQPQATQQSPATSELVQRVAEASEGTRNTTLNTVAFTAFTRGDTDEATREALIQASITSGLGRAEATATVASAWAAAWRKWQPINSWLDAVEQRIASTGLRSPWELATAEYLAALAMQLPKPWIDMSVRHLGEQIGTSHTIASRSIKQLVKWGLLSERAGKGIGHAKAYRLNLGEQKVDIHPSTPEGNGCMSSNCSPFGVRYRQGRLLRELLAHPAFSRIEGSAALTQTCAEVLVLLLTHGPMTRKDMTGSLGRSRTTIRQAIGRLESAEIVDDRGTEGVYLVVDGTGILEELDTCLRRMGKDHLAALRRYRHDQQRQAYYRQHRLLLPEPKLTPAATNDGTGPDAP